MTRILIVAGEASADRYGARLVEALRARLPEADLEFFGTGGDAMQRAGVELVCHIRRLATIGPREALDHFRVYYETFSKLVENAKARPPELAILIDFAEFNLRLAKKMRRAGTKVVYYISPQVWAWRSGRVRTIRRYVDQMLVILPFEEDYYRRRGVNARFVGHPLLDDFAPDRDREGFMRRFTLDPYRKTVALLPGSRTSEVRYILPTLVEAALRILDRVPAQFLISTAETVESGLVQRIATSILRGDARSAYFRMLTTPSRDLLANSDFALVKSGTSTLEAALVGTPFAIVYKISPVSWRLGNILIRTPFKGLVNLIAGEQIVPEFMQSDATPEALARVSIEHLEDPARCRAVTERLGRVRARLTAHRATETAASAIASHLERAVPALARG
jgi:lipid-A-disaccharide synthase